MIKGKSELYSTKNFKKLIKLNGFIKIPYPLAVWYDLTPAECMIYSYIDNATNNLKNKAFTDNETTLQALCNVAKGTVRKSLKNLCEKGLIEKTKEKAENGAIVAVYRSLKAAQLQIKIND